MSYIPISRDDTVWSGDYVGCGVGLGAAMSPGEFAAYTKSMEAAGLLQPRSPLPNTNGTITPAIAPIKAATVRAASPGWRIIETYKGWAIQTMPDPRYSCPDGAMCKITPSIYRAVQGAAVSPSGRDRSSLMRWVDTQSARPASSGPVTVRKSVTAPVPSTPQQQLVIGGGAPAAGDILVPPGATSVPSVVTASPSLQPEPTAPVGKGKGLLTAAGIAAAAYLLLG